MLKYIVKRILVSIPLLFCIVLAIFLMIKLAPGDPVAIILGNFPAPEEYRQILTERYSLNDPLWVQFGSYLAQLFQGNLGYSFAYDAPVAEIILSRLPASLTLVITGLVFGALLGIFVGTVSGRTRHKRLDDSLNVVVLIAFALPSFWLAQLLVLTFAMNLGWFPTSGLHSPSIPPGSPGSFLDTMQHLVLPVTALALVEFASVARIMRASTIEVSSSDFLDTASMKGLRRSYITRKHVLRNASLPVVTVIGYRFGQALAGVLLIEKVFGYPGMGDLLQQAVLKRDNQIIMGIVLIVAVSVVVINLLTDVFYSLLDPRIR